MQRIIVINNNDRALKYGIGSYTTNLIKCLQMTGFAFDIVCLNAGSYELKIIEKDGYREICVPAFAGSTDRKLITYSRMLPFLFNELFNTDDDIIFHFNYFITDELIAELKTVFNCRILLTVHCTDWSFMLNGDFRKLQSLLNEVDKEQIVSEYEKGVIRTIKSDKAIFQQTDLILFVAQHTAKSYSKISLLQDAKYMIVNNGLDDAYKKLSATQKRTIRKRYHIKEDETIIFFAGRLDEIKGIYCLIDAFKKVLRSKPDAHLFIAGEGDFAKLFAKSRSVCTQITFLGLLDKGGMHDFYGIADIGIVCSLYEEFGLVAVEMMMHQLPVIVTDTGGLAEIIDDNINGLKEQIINRKGKRTVETTKLAQKICYLIENPGECRRLGRNARKKFLSHYELQVFGQRMIQIYNTI
jgi:glycosyltransferase